jgi:hypothetical protein
MACKPSITRPRVSKDTAGPRVGVAGTGLLCVQSEHGSSGRGVFRRDLLWVIDKSGRAGMACRFCRAKAKECSEQWRLRKASLRVDATAVEIQGGAKAARPADSSASLPAIARDTPRPPRGRREACSRFPQASRGPLPAHSRASRHRARARRSAPRGESRCRGCEWF